jgi:probable rRNA maturation factor
MLEIRYSDAHWKRPLPKAKKLAEAAVAATLAYERVKQPVDITLTLAGDAYVRKLNHAWRGKDKPTNVLSFPLMPLGLDLPKGQILMLGDIVLARQTLLCEATAEGKSLAAHYQHLIVHGVLHLLGYDHEGDDETEDMQAREVRILKRLGVRDPYANVSPSANMGA